MGTGASRLSQQPYNYDVITIPDFEDGYPDPCPPDYPVETLFGGASLFHDDQFRNARTNTELFDGLTADINENTVQNAGGSDEVGGHVIERRRSHRRIDKPLLSFHSIDMHASQSHFLFESNNALIQYLTRPLHRDMFRKIKTARAIIIWMYQELMKDEIDQSGNTNTPRGLIQYVKTHRMSETTCFTLLCRKAGLKCAIIHGYRKEPTTVSGDDYTPEFTWCAVNVENGWQVVFPELILRGVAGYNVGGWTKVEQDGRLVKEIQVATHGVEVYTFTEQFFMPDPEKVIYRFCASQPEWQLVPHYLQITSREEFITRPIINRSFFDLDLELVSEHQSVLHTIDGFCTIKLKANPSNAHLISLKYELFKKDETDDVPKGNQAEVNISRMVFNARESSQFIFDIRFKQTGLYKLVIRGGPHKSTSLRLCEFRVICDEVMKNQNLLPLECGDVGWGAGPVAEDAGLYMPSKPSGLIPVSDQERKAEVKFQLRNMEDKYTAVVHGEVGGRRKQLDSSCVDIRKNEQLHQLQICVSIPEKGEYGLAIQHLNGKPSDGQVHAGQGENVCNYLISTLAYKPEPANIQKVRKKLDAAVSANVDPGNWKDQIRKIKRCMDRCKKEGIPETDDDLQAADAMVWFLTCKDKLRDCIQQFNLNVMRQTLAVVRRYKNQGALKKEIDEVQRLYKGLELLEELKKSYSTIAYQCSAAVQNTIRSLLVLLGYDKNMTMNWSDTSIRNVMSTSNQQGLTIIEQMENVLKQKLSVPVVQTTLNILHHYSRDQVRQASSDAYTFYIWIELVADMQESL